MHITIPSINPKTVETNQYDNIDSLGVVAFQDLGGTSFSIWADDREQAQKMRDAFQELMNLSPLTQEEADAEMARSDIGEEGKL